MNSISTIIYSDLNFKGITSPKALNIQAVFNSVKNILRTIPGERLNNPEFGCDLQNLLFDPVDDITAFAILNNVIAAINRWDNRVIIDQTATKIEPDPDNNKYDFTLVMSVVGLENDSFALSGSLLRAA